MGDARSIPQSDDPSSSTSAHTPISAAWEELSDLCRLPHRGSTTEEEGRAADWIAGRLERMRYAASRELFRAPRATLYTGPSIVLSVVAGSALLSDRLPLIAFLVTLAATLPLVGELLGRRRLNLDLLLPKHRSQNVIGRAPGHDSSEEASARHIILSAHYDTQLGSPLFAPRLVRGLRGRGLQVFFTLAYACVAGLLLILASGAFRGEPAEAANLLTEVKIALVLVAVLCAGWLLFCRVLGRHVNGANDNGSGVALALALARRIRKEGPPSGTRFTFVFTGAEEVGERGMRHFVDTLSTAPDGGADERAEGTGKPIVINLDNLGAGKMRYLTGEGMLRYYRYDPGLIAAARRVAERHPQDALSAWKNLPLPTDGLMAVTAGLPTITFIAIHDDGHIPNYHRHTDRLQGVDAELLAREADILWEYLHEL